MAQNAQKIDDLVASASDATSSTSDADMIAKLNEIALKVAEAQGKTTTQSTNMNVSSDPMDELGCEGCQ